MIGVHVRGPSLRQLIRAYSRQVPFAKAVALNRTGEEFNVALRQHIEDVFTVREQKLLRFVAPIPLRRDQQATKQNPTVRLKTEGLGTIFNPFEQGIPKVQRGPAEPVAIPTRELRPTPETVIPRKWYPIHLGLVERRGPGGERFFALGRDSIKKKKTPFSRTSGGKVQIRGKDRTFVLDPRFHEGVTQRQWGVYQRIGPEAGDVRMLWRFVKRVPRPALLRYEDILREIFRSRYAINFRGALALAIRTARAAS